MRFGRVGTRIKGCQRNAWTYIAFIFDAELGLITTHARHSTSPETAPLDQAVWSHEVALLKQRLEY